MSEPIQISDAILSFEASVSEFAASEQKTTQILRSNVNKDLLKVGFPQRHVMKSELFGRAVEVQKALWDKSVKSGDCLVLLIGLRGRGKTQIATEWARRRIVEQNNAPGRYYSAVDIFTEIKATWAKDSKVDEAGVLARMTSTKYLVIDELHERGNGDWENRTLMNLIDKRYYSNLATILCGNFADEVEAEKGLSASIIDRANETGGVVVCNWESYRI